MNPERLFRTDPGDPRYCGGRQLIEIVRGALRDYTHYGRTIATRRCSCRRECQP